MFSQNIFRSIIFVTKEIPLQLKDYERVGIFWLWGNYEITYLKLISVFPTSCRMFVTLFRKCV